MWRLSFIVERLINDKRSTINDSNTCNNFVHLLILKKNKMSEYFNQGWFGRHPIIYDFAGFFISPLRKMGAKRLVLKTPSGRTVQDGPPAIRSNYWAKRLIFLALAGERQENWLEVRAKEWPTSELGLDRSLWRVLESERLGSRALLEANF